MQSLSRRGWLGLSAAAGAAAALRPAPVSAQDPAARAFIDRAFALRMAAQAAGDQPYGAVVVHDGRIVGEAPSRVVVDGDPTAHAEMEAIRDAARRLGGRDLSGCVLYSSSRPCPMCEAAAYWAGIGGVVHGEAMTDAGAPRLNRC
ncbi:MAG: nucleoside deaminase [Rhodospirillales bacterium]